MEFNCCRRPANPTSYACREPKAIFYGYFPRRPVMFSTRKLMINIFGNPNQTYFGRSKTILSQLQELLDNSPKPFYWYAPAAKSK